MADSPSKHPRAPEDPKARSEYIEELKRLRQNGQLHLEVDAGEVPDRLLDLLTPQPLKDLWG